MSAPFPGGWGRERGACGRGLMGRGAAACLRRRLGLVCVWVRLLFEVGGGVKWAGRQDPFLFVAAGGAARAEPRMAPPG